MRLCRAEQAVIYRLEDGIYRYAAGHSSVPEYLKIEEQTTILAGHGTVAGRAAMTRQVARIDDAWTDPLYEKKDDARLGGVRSMIGVPLMRDGEPIGVIGLARNRVEPFTDREIELVTTFADQAVIAIENVRLFEAEQQRTRELTESLEQQTATAQVLQVISSSPGELQPVFDSILANAAHLCEANFGTLNLYKDGTFPVAAMHDVPPAYAEFRRLNPHFRVVDGHPLARVAAAGQVQQIFDMRLEPLYLEKDPSFVAMVEHAGARTLFLVPMLKDNDVIGVITIFRQEVRPFSHKQIALVQNFAAQAVIAIENARLLSELRQSLEQQTATADVLRVISSSPGELEPVFETMLANATRLCEAKFGLLFRFDGEAYHFAADVGTSPELAEFVRRRGPFQPMPVTLLARVMRTKQLCRTDDYAADAPNSPPVKFGGARSTVDVPLLKDNALIGAFSIYRQEVRPFTNKQVELVQNFAAQAVIAIENARLLTELRQRTDDLTESLEQQTATSEVLQVISSSPGDLEPVFATMLENATRICGATSGDLLLYKGDTFRIVAMHGPPSEWSELRRRDPTVRPPANDPLGRLAATRQLQHVTDMRNEPAYIARFPGAVAAVELGGMRTVLAVPILKDDELIGAFAIYRQEVRPFTDKQIALVTSFAAQAVIAIENTRLLTELRQRTDDLTESLEQQTATSEVLQVISSSPGDLEPVFASMLENAVRICGATFGNIYRWDGEALHLVATHNTPPAFAEARRRVPVRPTNPKGLNRMLVTKAAVHVRDAAETPGYIDRSDAGAVAAVELGGARTTLAVPMLKENELIGSFTVYRQEVRPFTDKQIALVTSFASQAVIAIENTRLLNELRQRTDDLTESLEQQTATSEVLGVISRSPGDLSPVFQSVLQNATRLCGAAFGNLLLREDDKHFRFVALHNAPPALAALHHEAVIELDPEAPLLRAVAAKAPIQVHDFTEEPIYKRGHAAAIALGDLGGARTFVVVPLLKENEAIGGFAIYRQEVRPFTDKQIALVTSFANQAVIAIENARLLNELRQRTSDLTESLEQQTATSEVLQVISSSPGDLQPVFDAMLENAVQICDASSGNIYRWEGDALHHVAARNTPAAFAAQRRSEPFRPAPINSVGQMIASKAVVHIPDVAASEAYAKREPVTVAGVEIGGIKTFLAVPMLKDNELIGAIALARQEIRPFTEKQIDLVTNFAAQAVIAIENTRLLTELRQRTDDLTESLEQQTATSEVLQVISSSPGDLQPVFATMLENAVRICRANFGNMFLYEGDAYRVAAMHNPPPAFVELRRREPLFHPGPLNPAVRVAATKKPVHIADLAEDAAYTSDDPVAVGFVQSAGVRTLLVVPMLKESEFIGGFAIFRQEVRPFTDKQIALVQNFAAQAVIAIENARLLTELRQRTDELGRSVGELRALGEVSQAVNSTLDLETVLSTIVAKAVQLSGTEAGAIYVFDDAQREFHLRATYGMDQELIEALSHQHIGFDAPIFTPGVPHGEPVQRADLRDEASSEVGEIILRAGYRARLMAPLVRGEETIGMLVVRRKTPGAFPQNTVELMKTFAAQSVLAIQNARLFHEIEDKGRQIEVASRHKSQFLANMSHELRTPLNAILGYTELILDSIYGEAPEKMRDVLERVQTNGKHLLGLINDVLDLSKIEAGQLTLSLSDYSLTNLVQGVYVAVEPLAAKKNLALKTKIAPSLPAGHGDERRLAQVLLNLVGNAIKFTDNGEVAIEPSCADGAFRVAVRELGAGYCGGRSGENFRGVPAS